MRLNRIESFYAFLLHFHSKGREEGVRPPTAKPRPRPPTRGRLTAIRASLKGRLVPLTGAAVRRCGTYGHSRLWQARTSSIRMRAHPLATRHPQRGPTAGRTQGAAARG
ncbi:hypothetical protein B296_00037799 [Ensete ventricosum]|uniref:Uncharacterized protein n=1 Tax=Ensete ventricosum TaxID=4639 RepID=A0A426X1I6_ENSVE|nr:hypothetical protein B296_00037799 [Ensete ventricosum]